MATKKETAAAQAVENVVETVEKTEAKAEEKAEEKDDGMVTIHLFKDDDRCRLVDDTAKASLLQAGRVQIPVSSDGGEPLVDQPDAHPRRQEASQVSGPVAGVPGRARAATAHALGQTDDHLEGTVLIDEVNGLVEISTITVPPESYHRKR